MAVVTSSIQDTSFSSYLTSTNEKTMLRKLGDQRSSLNLSPIITITTSPSKHLGNSKREEEDEIGVFGAEKYFNGAMDEDSSTSSTSPCSSMKLYVHQKHQLVNNLDHVKLKVPKQHGTPSVRSEASSWNSQSALLKSGSRKPKRADKTMATPRKKGFFAALGCSCSDKNSIDVNDHQHGGEISFKQNGVNIKQSLDLVSEAIVKIKQAPDSWVKEEILENGEKIEKLGAGLSRENCFTFPDANSEAMSNLRSKIPLFQEIEDEKVRKSIEVFGAPVLEKRKKAIGLEKRVSLMLWEAEFDSVKSGGNYAHESDSDASSDLFEIESLKGKNNSFLARQASDGCAIPTHCYAPSEVSVDWSVVTASAADFSYAVSDCERSPTKVTNAKSARMMSKEMAPIRNRSNVLLSCKSHKAVQVADNAHRPHNPKTIIDPPTMPCKPAMPSTRFPGDTNSKLTGFESRVHALAPRSVPHARSPHTSHLLYMQ